jgi:hypothetical protein
VHSYELDTRRVRCVVVRGLFYGGQSVRVLGSLAFAVLGRPVYGERGSRRNRNSYAMRAVHGPWLFLGLFLRRTSCRLAGRAVSSFRSRTLLTGLLARASFHAYLGLWLPPHWPRYCCIRTHQPL